MSGRVEGLENLRREKRYVSLLKTVENEGLGGEQKVILPKIIDAVRGLVQRTIFPQEIEDLYLRLMGVGEIYLNDSNYVDEVNSDKELSISYRRDLSRLYVAMAPVVSSPGFNLKDISRHLLLKARQMDSEGDSCRRDLMLIETQNMMAKNGRRVDIYNTIEPLMRILQNVDKNPDRNRAIIDWSMETALLRGRGVGDVLGTIDKNMPLAEKLKKVARAESRLLQTRSREIGILLLNPTLPKNNRIIMRNNLVQIGNRWIGGCIAA